MLKTINFLPTKIQYQKKTNKIRLWYRTKDNFQLSKKDLDFNYYCYVDTRFCEELDLSKFEVDSSVVYKRLTDDREMYKVYCSPEDSRMYIDSGVFAESDVSPEQKFICDKFYDIEYPSDILPRIYFLDIETYSTDGIIPSFNHNIAEINAITIYDTYSEKYVCWFLSNTDESLVKVKHNIVNVISEYGETEVYVFDNPAELLKSFCDFIIINPPDIITAWNSKFDIQYIVRKICDYFGLNMLRKISPFFRTSSIVNKALESGLTIDRDALIPGIDVIDMLELYKKYTSETKPSYALKHISEEELEDETKLNKDDDDSPIKMYETDFYKFCKYNVQDVRLLVLINKKRKLLDLANVIRNLTKIDYQNIFYETVMLDNKFLMKAIDRRHNNWKYCLPNKPRNVIKTKFLGAYVKPTISSLVKWALDLDFTSLYPSIAKTFLLSNETLVGTTTNFQLLTLLLLSKEFDIPLTKIDKIMHELLPKYLNFDVDILKLTRNSKNNPSTDELLNNITLKIQLFDLYVMDKRVLEFKGYNEFKNWLVENQYAFLPSGVIVDQKKNDALLAEIIADIMESRKYYKQLMFKALEENNKNLADIYDMYQTAVKIINNSVYGATANEKFRMFNLFIAEGITTTGQLIIKTSTYSVNQELNNHRKSSEYRDYVITNDTDSIIFTVEDLVDIDINEKDINKLKSIVNYAQMCQSLVNQKMIDLCQNICTKPNCNEDNVFLKIKNEWLASSAFFVTKKAYVIHMVLKEGIQLEKTKYTGISVKRSNTPKALKPFLSEIIEMILNWKSKEEINKIIRLEYSKIKKSYSMRDISIPISIKEDYKNVPIQLRGANVWNNYYAEDDTEKIKTGKIRFLYVKNFNNKILDANKEYVIGVPDSPKYWKRIEGKIEVDYAKMVERLIVKPVKGFYDVFGWKIPEYNEHKNNVFSFKK